MAFLKVMCQEPYRLLRTSDTLTQAIEKQLSFARSSDFASFNETAFKQVVLSALIGLQETLREPVCMEIVSEFPVEASPNGEVGRIDLLIAWDKSGGAGDDVNMIIIELKYVPLKSVRDDRVWSLVKKRHNHRDIAEVTKLEDRRKAFNQFCEASTRNDLWTLKVMRGRKTMTMGQVGDEAMLQARSYLDKMRASGLSMRHMTEDLKNVSKISQIYHYAIVGVGNVALLLASNEHCSA